MTREPFVSWSAELAHGQLDLGAQVFLGDDVVIYSADGTGSVAIAERSCLHRGVILETSDGGNIAIGSNSHIQPGCQLSAARGSIYIGSEVQIAPACGFYPYSHGMALGRPMREQPVTSKGDITLGNDVWVGYGAILLEGAKVGEGAVVAAGAVVRDEVPPYAIVAGVPSRIVGYRREQSNERD